MQRFGSEVEIFPAVYAPNFCRSPWIRRAVFISALAQSFGLAARRITDPQDIAPALREGFASGKPNLIDMRVADGFGG